MDILAEIAAWIRVAKGDTPGHPFRGNQFTEGELASQAVDLVGRLASGERSRSIGREHDTLSVMHQTLSTRHGDAHDDAAAAHAEAAEMHHLAENGRTTAELRYGKDNAADATTDASRASAIAAGWDRTPTTYIGGTPSTIGQGILTGSPTPPTPRVPTPIRQDPDEGEALSQARPQGRTAESVLPGYHPAGSSTGDINRNRIAGMTSNRLEDLRLAIGSLSHLAEMQHGYASTRVRGELGAIREAIQHRITDVKNEFRAGGSKFVKGEGNQPTRGKVEYKNLIKELTEASKAVSGLRSSWSGKNNPNDFSNGHFAQNAPFVAHIAREALDSYEKFYAGTDGKDTGYFGDDKFKKTAPTRFVISIAGDVIPL
jgi:hypothetical protein